jgi:hypothetical protein
MVGAFMTPTEGNADLFFGHRSVVHWEILARLCEVLHWKRPELSVML